MKLPRFSSPLRAANCWVLAAAIGCGAEAPSNDDPTGTDGFDSDSGTTGTGTPSSTSAGMSGTTATVGTNGASTTGSTTSAGVGAGNVTTTGGAGDTTGSDASGSGGTSSTSGNSSTTSPPNTTTTATTTAPSTSGNTSDTTSGNTSGGGTGNTSGNTSSDTSGGGTGNTGCGAAGFHIEGSSVYDVNCNEFVMRGVNVPHAWFSSNTQGTLSDSASVGANTVRVVLATGGQWSRTDGSTVSQIISWAKDNRLVAMLEVHDSTGYGESSGALHPDDAVSYWTSSDVLGAISGQEAYVMINVANEPFGNSESSQWSSFHQGAVQALRAAGLKHLLVVDAPNWGQDWEENMKSDKEGAASNILDADPDRNVLFSVHMYDVYSSPDLVTSYIDTFLGHGLALVVGEFAADHGPGTNVEEGTIMSKAEQSRIGYIGWSWSGNGGDLGTLDITSNFNVDSLTTWGSTLINGPSGIAETAQTCSCFE